MRSLPDTGRRGGNHFTQRKVERTKTEGSTERDSRAEFVKCPIYVLKGYPPVIPAYLPSAVPGCSLGVGGAAFLKDCSEKPQGFWDR